MDTHYQGERPSGVRSVGGSREGAPREAQQGGSWVLGSETHRRLIGSLVATAAPGSVVTLEPPRRSLDQNKLLHRTITEAVAGGLATDDGYRLTVDDAKTAFVTAWMVENGQASDMIIFGRKPVQLRRSTTTFTKAELSSLIEYIRAECFHRGIPLSEPAPAKAEAR